MFLFAGLILSLLHHILSYVITGLAISQQPSWMPDLISAGRVCISFLSDIHIFLSDKGPVK